MKRNPVNPSLDAAVFRRTASGIKAINIKPTHYRGGIRF